MWRAKKIIKIKKAVVILKESNLTNALTQNHIRPKLCPYKIEKLIPTWEVPLRATSASTVLKRALTSQQIFVAGKRLKFCQDTNHLFSADVAFHFNTREPARAQWRHMTYRRSRGSNFFLQYGCRKWFLVTLNLTSVQVYESIVLAMVYSFWILLFKKIALDDTQLWKQFVHYNVTARGHKKE